jgi:AraC family transcriptional regulator, regulatory protein of adaptative response / methylated-DNA-[protein]-cysteine methyltransferase
MTYRIIPYNEKLPIRYDFITSPFARLLVAQTAVGICFITLADEGFLAFERLQKAFPGVQLEKGGRIEAIDFPCAGPRQTDLIDVRLSRLKSVFCLLNDPAFAFSDYSPDADLTFHLKGTPFQLAVWKALLHIPFGQTATYKEVAALAGYPTALRAVGTAIGANPVYYLIPCHRVIRSDGQIGNYLWGTPLKKALLDWEKQGF